MTANLLGYVLYALLSRVLGVEAYGTFSSLLAIVVIVSTPALVAQMVVAKLASDFAHDARRLSGLVRAVDIVSIRGSVGAAAALAALAVPLASFLHIADPLLIVLTALSLCGTIALPFARGILQGTSSFVAFAISNIVEAFGKALCAPLLALVAGLRGALSGVAVGYAAAAIYTFVAVRPHARGERVMLSLRSVAGTSLGVAGVVFCINVLLFYDVVLAKRYLDPHTVGLYGAAALAGRALYAVTAFIPTVLLPQTANRRSLGERTRWLFLQALGLTVGLCLSVFTFYALEPRWVIITITTSKFAAGSAFLVPYVGAVSALAIANVIATYNIARGRLRFLVPLAIVALGEITAVVLRHSSAVDLLQTIVIGHTLALVACATSLGGSGGASSQPGERAA